MNRFRLNSRPFVIAAITLLTALWTFVDAAQASAQDTTEARGELHLLAIGVCPPYREHIPVVVCRNSVNNIAKNVKDNMDIKPDNIQILLDEQTSGRNVLATLEEYKKTLNKDDRLIVYMLLHGDAFHLWADAYEHDGIIGEINETFVPPDEDILVFWTKDEPTVPALALAEKDWLTATEVAENLDAIEAQVALILDSCSSGLFFQRMADKALGVDNIDFIMTSAGAEQISNFDTAVQISLFARELGNAINLPYVRNFGQAIEHARMTTVLHATAQCTDLLIDANAFTKMFPKLPVPSVQTADGKVTPALWACAQVPSVVDLKGKVSALEIN